MTYPLLSTTLARLAATAGLCVTVSAAVLAATAPDTVAFKMVRAKNLPVTCVPSAKAYVSVRPQESAERMTITAVGLPRNTEFDLFVLQVPNFPFGVSWYVGDMKTDGRGVSTKTFVSRFNHETFAVAPDKAPAPKLHPQDAVENPAFKPIHTLHLGIWFNSAKDAERAGCPKIVTPFNGTHDAGVQVLSTRTFPDAQGPLINVK